MGEWDEHGKLRAFSEMPEHVKKQIKSVKVEEYVAGTDILDNPIIERKITVELWDRVKQIELLGKYKKMFTDKIEANVEGNVRLSFRVDLSEDNDQPSSLLE